MTAIRHRVPLRQPGLISQLDAAPPLLIIDGGEPLCREDLLDILKYASSKGLRTTIGSNATLIDEGVAKKLLEVGVMAVAISVDGVDAHTHDSFRGMSGAFDQTLKGIEACRNTGLPFQLNMVIRRENLSQLEAKLRKRELLKGECGECTYRGTCSGCRGRAYEETGDMMASDPGCWLIPELAKKTRSSMKGLDSSEQQLGMCN